MKNDIDYDKVWEWLCRFCNERIMNPVTKEENIIKVSVCQIIGMVSDRYNVDTTKCIEDSFGRIVDHCCNISKSDYKVLYDGCHKIHRASNFKEIRRQYTILCNVLCDEYDDSLDYCEELILDKVRQRLAV